MSWRYETHCHTGEASRCARVPAEEQVRYYHSLGFDGIIITDHFLGGNTTAPAQLGWKRRIEILCSGYKNARAEGKRLGLKVFFGWEFAHLGCDFLTYGLSPEWLLENENLDQMPIVDYLQYVRREGALVIHAHPFREAPYIPYIQLLPRQVDGVEILNACRKDFENERAAEYARAYGLPVFAGGDNHSAAKQTRLCGIETEEPLESIRDFIRVFRAGEYRMFDSREE